MPVAPVRPCTSQQKPVRNEAVDVDPRLEAAIAQALRGKRMERHESAAAFRSSLAELSLA